MNLVDLSGGLSRRPRSIEPPLFANSNHASLSVSCLPRKYLTQDLERIIPIGEILEEVVFFEIASSFGMRRPVGTSNFMR